jgi:hypothetical protein
MEENINQGLSGHKLPKSLTTVTTFSKILAMILFVVLPFLGFYLGIKYQEGIQIKTYQSFSTTTTKFSGRTCTMEVKLCPDGSYVSRTGPNCEFSPCPGVTSSSAKSEITNWKTYTNIKYGFSVKYPNTMLLIDCSNFWPKDNTPNVLAIYNSLASGNCDKHFDIKDGLVIEVKPRTNSFQPVQDYVSKQEEITIDGVKGKKIWWENDLEHPTSITSVLFLNGNVIFLDLRGATLINTYNEILYSFKSIN